MKRKPNHYILDWEGESLEQLGPQWARLGLEPSVSCNVRLMAGDTVQAKGCNQRMVISREVSEQERRERRRLMGYGPSATLFCYIVFAD